MAYWEYPDSITTTYTNKNSEISPTIPNFSIDKDNPNAQHIGETFDIPWKVIKNHHSNCCLSMKCEQIHWKISALLRQIGELNHSVYYTHPTDDSKNRTGSSYRTNSLFKMGYTTPSQSYKQGLDWTLINFELNNLRPLLIDGSGAGGGHTWVLDGYIDKEEKTTYYEFDYFDYFGDSAIPNYKIVSVIESQQQLVHFNWGWGGECDGYFAVGEIVKTTQGTYDSNISITHDLYFLQENISLSGGIHPRI